MAAALAYPWKPKRFDRLGCRVEHRGTAAAARTREMPIGWREEDYAIVPPLLMDEGALGLYVVRARRPHEIDMRLCATCRGWRVPAALIGNALRGPRPMVASVNAELRHPSMGQIERVRDVWTAPKDREPDVAVDVKVDDNVEASQPRHQHDERLPCHRVTDNCERFVLERVE